MSDPTSTPATPLSGFLRGSIWAANLGSDTLERVESEVLERSVPGGGVVCRKGAPVDYWVGVIEGLVKISSVSAEGKSVTFTGVRAGGWFGEGSVLRTAPWGYDGVALRDCRVALMPRATFIGMLESDRLLEPEARVARCLASLFNPHLYPGSGRDLQISQGEIGYLSGVSRQRVNQALQVLEKAGLLRVAYGGVSLVDLPGLGRYGT